MQSGRLILALLLLAGACARAAAPPAPTPTPAEPVGDPELYRILGSVPHESAAALALQRYELDHPLSFLEKVAEVASDPAAGLPARFQAVQLLGERQAGKYVPALRDALTDPDARVRAAAVVAAGRLLAKSAPTGRSVVLAALEDSAPEVQAKALEVFGASDAPLLREFLAQHPQGEAAVIARGLLRAGEERGAPLAGDTTGVLRRSTEGGIRLEFRATRRWPQWDAAVGVVSIAGGSSPAFSIPDVEVVAAVVPVFFAPDESAIVYEQGRRIYVRELRTGGVREVGTGIAPRPLPFTGEFIY
ncbi:MAG: hypothetical protein FIB01_11800 [Gemmatimonadetes bacterium]|nr:hypothetical protein [Gemmatimonadota bacterium]